jgi:hypothetical protein
MFLQDNSLKSRWAGDKEACASLKGKYRGFIEVQSIRLINGAADLKQAAELFIE